MGASDNRNPGVFVHPKGLCESDQVGAGTRVWAFAHVMAGATVGRGCNICDHAFVEAGARLGDGVTVKNAVLVWDGVDIGHHVFLGPAVTFTNDLTPRADVRKTGDALMTTRVEDGATIGANATIVCGVTIGRRAFVAAGSVVTRDVAPHALVAGSPAKPLGWVCSCGMRLDERLACACGRRFRHADGERAEPGRGGSSRGLVEIATFGLVPGDLGIPPGPVVGVPNPAAGSAA